MNIIYSFIIICLNGSNRVIRHRIIQTNDSKEDIELTD